jgi:membrane-associated phospholipid phosphatase
MRNGGRGAAWRLALCGCGLAVLAVAPSARAQRGGELPPIGVRVAGPTGTAVEAGAGETGEQVAARGFDGVPSLAEPGLRWREEWRRFGVAEGVFSGLMTSAALATYLMPESHTTPRWRGGIVADDATRAELTLDTHHERELAATASDVLMGGLAAAPVLVDVVLTAWLLEDSPDVALQMLLMDFQAHAVAQGLTGIFKWAVRRERPIARGCRESEARRTDDPTCQGSDEPAVAPHSFFSGHTSVAFTGAALICVHHTELGLLGEAGDAAACATGLTFASAVGVLRLMADRHYLSDVVIGAGVGLLSGWLLPYVLHYAQFGGGPGSHFRAAVAPSFDRDRLGLQAVGQF